MKNVFAMLFEAYLSRSRGAYRLQSLFSRLSRDLIPEEVYTRGSKLNVGSGSCYLEGYINVDILPERSPDVVCNVDNLSFASDNQFDLVRASHIIEHIAYDDCPIVLAEWRRVIKPGGYLIVCTPDYIRLCWRGLLAASRFDPASRNYAAGWMNGLFALDLPFEFRHKFFFTERSLSNLLQKCGFIVIGRQNTIKGHPTSLGKEDDSCSLTSLNLVAKKV